MGFFHLKGNRLKKSRPESCMAMQEVKLAGATSSGDVPSLLSAVPAEPGAPGAAPWLVAPPQSPAQVPACPPCPLSPEAVQRWLCSSGCTAWPNPASGCRATTMPRHSCRLPPCRCLALCPLRSRGKAAGCSGPPPCKDPRARSFGELLPEAERSQKPAWQNKSWLKQPAGLVEHHPVLLFGQGPSFRGLP